MPFARPDEEVTYTCSATAVCGTISLTIESDGVTKQTAADTAVTWNVDAAQIANSEVTCMSSIRCPPVNVTGELSNLCQTVILNFVMRST